MENNYFSIIVPIYKVENFLEKCIESVLQQTFLKYELILVNDGSPDKCGVIADNFAKKDHRIKVIHKKNGGLSEARNFGLMQATGKYILFLDSDDYWDDIDALQKLSIALEKQNSDILIFGCKDFDVQRKEFVSKKTEFDLSIFQNDKKEIVEYLLKNNIFPGAAWILTVKKSILTNNNIQFRIGVKAEDIEWLISIFINAQKIDAINECFYVYLKNRQNSITATPDSKSILGILHAIDSWKLKLKSEKSPLLSFLQYQYFIAIMILNNKNLENRKLIFSELKKHKDLLNISYSYTTKAKLLASFIRFFGLLKSSKILAYVYKKQKEN